VVRRPWIGFIGWQAFWKEKTFGRVFREGKVFMVHRNLHLFD
jgi:hypothetical protein